MSANIKPLPGLPGVFFEVLPKNQYMTNVQFYINRDHKYIGLHRYDDLYAPDVKAWLGLAADIWSRPTGFDWVKTPLEELKQRDVFLKVLRTVQRMDDYLNGKTSVGKLNDLGMSANLAFVLNSGIPSRKQQDLSKISFIKYLLCCIR